MLRVVIMVMAVAVYVCRVWYVTLAVITEAAVAAVDGVVILLRLRCWLLR